MKQPLLLHAARGNGRSRQRILYWFRTPPGVKVGRPALDEAAIRWIEEHNPDIEFDWPKILEAQPPAPRQPKTRAIAAGGGTVPRPRRTFRATRHPDRQPRRRPASAGSRNSRSPNDEELSEPELSEPGTVNRKLGTRRPETDVGAGVRAVDASGSRRGARARRDAGRAASRARTAHAAARALRRAADANRREGRRSPSGSRRSARRPNR